MSIPFRLCIHMPENHITSMGSFRMSRVLARSSLAMLALLVTGFTSCVPQKTETPGKLQKTVELHYQLGINYLNEGKTPQALKELLAAQTLAPGNADVEHALGLAYQRKGMYNEAIEQYKKALTKEPKFTEAKNNLGTAFLAKGEPDEAIPKFEECLGDPNYSTPEKAAYNLGVAYNQKKDVDKAILNYERAALLKKDNINALFNLGFCHEEKKDLAKALENYKKAVEIDPSFKEALYRMGLIYQERKEYSPAYDMFRKVVEIDHEYMAAHLKLADLMLIEGSKTEGIKKLEFVIKSDPEGQIGQEAKRLLEQTGNTKTGGR